MLPIGTIISPSSLSPVTTIALPKMRARIKQKIPILNLNILIPLNIVE
jgi:hypothetical protein